ncbi:MAG TPA: cation diffusion facilitator family transporter [Gaiellaceae bacterium]|nr:cation diffusion facilitator family transporter [Gaiellaceae bacterium]
MGERKTVLVALGANLAVAVVKGIAGVVSGSAAMLAEAAHSVADTANQLLLLISIERGQREADREHPFGHGKERFFWSFLAAVLIFVAGAVFSVGQGILELVHSKEQGSAALVYGTLAFALVAEGASLVRAVRQTRASARAAGKDWRQFVRESTEPAAKTVLAEDTVAVLGILVAAIGFGLRQATGNAAWDAGAAIVIGAILAYVAYQLGRNYKDLLIGAGARPEDVERIRRVLESHPGVDGVLDLRTMYIGPESLLVAARVDLAHNGLDAEGIERLANELDERLRREVPAVSEVFLDPTPRTEPEPSK